jgi:predicted PurR-regulated permease PerM
MKYSKSLLIYLFIFILLLSAFFFFSGSMLIPIFLSIIIAYLMNPVVKYLILRGFGRKTAAAVSLLFLLIISAAVIFYVVPGIIKDMLGIIGNLGTYGSTAKVFLKGIGYESMPEYLKNAVDYTGLRLQSLFGEYLNSLFAGLISFTLELPNYINFLFWL